MKLKNFIFTLTIATLIAGCSAKSKGFFEDLYSQTEVRPATKDDYAASIQAPEDAPIIKETKEEKLEDRAKLNGNYISDASQLYHAEGKIIDADYDRDVNLYVYAFLKTGAANPISFYYDKDLRPIGDVVTITVKDNFLTSISKGSDKSINNNVKKSSRKYKKRKRSDIKTPIVEKINTL